MNESDLDREPLRENSQPSARGAEVRGYTIALGSLGLLMLLGAIVLYSILDAPSTDPDSRWAIALVARIEFVLAGVACFVAVLRARQSRHAQLATASFSWLLLISFPIGTAFWAYWFFKVRPRERPA